jgi:hypothetical protein
MEALSDKTVLLVTHQVDFLTVFDSILVSFHIRDPNDSLSARVFCRSKFSYKYES